MRFKFARQARRHRIGKAHALRVMEGEPVENVRPSGDIEFEWVGLDDTGRELRVIAVAATDDRKGDAIVLVLHVMPTALERRER